MFHSCKNKITGDKILAPCLVDTTTNFVAHPLLAAERIKRFIDIVGEDRVQAGSDLGIGAYVRVTTLASGAGLMRHQL